MQKKRISRSVEKQLNNQIQDIDYEEDVINFKQDQNSRPLVLAKDRRIFLDTNHKLYRVAYQFLSAIADPIHRPVNIHQYRISKFSLYTAMVLDYTTGDILQILGLLAKNKEIPKQVVKFIKKNSENYGGGKLYLQNGKYYFDCNEQVQKIVKKNKQVYKILQFIGDIQEQERGGVAQQIFQNLKDIIDQQNDHKKVKQKIFKHHQVKDDYCILTKMLITNNIPLVQEYHFEKCLEPKIDIQLRVNTTARFYQEKSLKNIFNGNKAKSGIIVLPCGAGKTLVAIIAIARIKRNAIIICDGDISVDQWKDQFIKWTTVDSRKIIRITGKTKDKILDHKEPFIAITTYSMVTRFRQNTKQGSHVSILKSIRWGVCIADQVHKLPAQTFQNVLKQYSFNIKLGFTATPFRQDNKIDNLFYMVGPKLYQQNWLDLVNQGSLAKPFCVQVQCKMTPVFQKEYQNNQQQLLHTANPNKFRVLKFLIKAHQRCNHKIIVFCDRPRILEYYAKKLKYPFIHGQIKQDQRKQLLNLFRKSSQLSTIFLSRVGDIAIDIPIANVAIQIGYHYGSRRQQIQRLGRIMRPKQSKKDEYNAFFYSLISQQTKQQIYGQARKQCLINLGLKYQILQGDKIAQTQKQISKQFQLQFLQYVLSNHRQGDKFLKTIQSKQITINKQKVQNIFPSIYAQSRIE